jgi:VanZ family protein
MQGAFGPAPDQLRRGLHLQGVRFLCDRLQEGNSSAFGLSFGREKIRMFRLSEQPRSLMASLTTYRPWVPVGLYALVIFLFSSLPGRQVPLPFPAFDKILHLLEYIPFGILVIRAFCKSFVLTPLQALLWGIFVITLYALSDEVHQLFVPGRLFSYADMAFDVLGGSMGGLVTLWRR